MYIAFPGFCVCVLYVNLFLNVFCFSFFIISFRNIKWYTDNRIVHHVIVLRNFAKFYNGFSFLMFLSFRCMVEYPIENAECITTLESIYKKVPVCKHKFLNCNQLTGHTVSLSTSGQFTQVSWFICTLDIDIINVIWKNFRLLLFDNVDIIIIYIVVCASPSGILKKVIRSSFFWSYNFPTLTIYLPPHIILYYPFKWMQKKNVEKKIG